MAAATAKIVNIPERLVPQPEKTELDARIEEMAEPEKLSFDPDKLKERYLAERDKRLRHGRGVEQYRMAEGNLSHYLKDPWVEPIERDPIEEEVDVVIIGGGYGAQLVAVKLIEAGITNIRMLEKAGDFGGTWYWNRYPGAQCDIESYIYMPLIEELGFMPSEKYARAKELLRHSELIGRKWGLHEKALFQTEATSLHWNEETVVWTARTSRGDTIRSRFVVPAAGPLHRPKLPGLSGVESFKGQSFHSSRWDYHYTGGDSSGGLTKLADKRVGIIGTGATAVQIVPHLGAWAKETYVFQRTPSSIDFRGNAPTNAEWAAGLQKGWQKKRMENFNLIVNGSRQDEDMVSDGWTEIISKLFSPRQNQDKSVESVVAQRQLADFKKMESIRARCDRIVQDKGTADSLKPWYNQFCKRPCFHDEYLPTFNRPNVHLIDTRGDGVEAITENGIVANGEEFKLDCIIYATGFELATDWTHRAGLEIYGRNGQTITDKWKQGASTLHGWTTRGFPNCFWVSIVQAALTPNFIHVTTEQAEHLTYVIKTCKERNISTVEPTQVAEDNWVGTILGMRGLRAAFLKECTPGYYNNEGRESETQARNAGYGAGSPAFIKILQDWRAKDDFGGLEVKKFSSGASKFQRRGVDC